MCQGDLLIQRKNIFIHTMPGGTSRRKDVPGPSWDGVNELALAAFTAGVAGVCMAREDIWEWWMTATRVLDGFELEFCC